MKKIIPGLFILCCFAGTGYAQSFDDIISKRKYIDCKDVDFNAPELIHALYAKGEIDSVYTFLDYWQNKCGNIDYIHAIRLLLDIKTANFDSTLINDELFASLISYKERNKLLQYTDIDHNPEFNQLQKSMQNETQAIAASIHQTYSPDEKLLQNFYTADSVSFDELKAASAKDSKLKRLYNKKVNEALSLPESHLALFAGYYHPFGKLDVFGAHPSIGFIMGGRHLKHTLDLVMDIRFGKSKNEYEFIYQAKLLKDDAWTSVYVGVEYTYDFIQSKKFRVGLSPGIAYNGITAVTADDDNYDDAKILPGFDVSGGLAFKYTYGKRGGYVGLQARYHWVSHRNPAGTELTGDYLSLRLIFGALFNYEREYRLNTLDY